MSRNCWSETRGLKADHTTVWRWVQRYAPELDRRLRHHLKPTNKSWRVDETYVRVQGRWCYLYRAIDSAGATIDFLLSALRDADAAKRLFRGALSNSSHPQPRVINTDLAPIYGSAISDIKKEGTLPRRCRHRPVQYLNNILEQGTIERSNAGVERQAKAISESSRRPSERFKDMRRDKHDSERASSVGWAGLTFGVRFRFIQKLFLRTAHLRF